ncbi:hypothetical protein SCHPADRAFT_30643 [Schizopora paradoxa]|uniref:Uncharacterized protein n=1 Tax=Schizopora paradoxa TaxID=27342 RepID=A0A0H2S862_9AGAM|nr:hypothetical protein SCHPADRAFT_30643 [Schizopora paradoxa]
MHSRLNPSSRNFVSTSNLFTTSLRIHRPISVCMPPLPQKYRVESHNAVLARSRPSNGPLSLRTIGFQRLNVAGMPSEASIPHLHGRFAALSYNSPLEYYVDGGAAALAFSTSSRVYRTPPSTSCASLRYLIMITRYTVSRCFYPIERMQSPPMHYEKLCSIPAESCVNPYVLNAAPRRDA